jgi:hypothetical protein
MPLAALYRGVEAVASPTISALRFTKHEELLRGFGEDSRQSEPQ